MASYGSKSTFDKTDLDHFPARVFLCFQNIVKGFLEQTKSCDELEVFKSGNNAPSRKLLKDPSTVPAVPKDACTFLSLQAKKPKNLLLEHVWMVWEGWGDAGKSCASMSVKFELFGREKTQENHQNHFPSF